MPGKCSNCRKEAVFISRLLIAMIQLSKCKKYIDMNILDYFEYFLDNSKPGQSVNNALKNSLSTQRKPDNLAYTKNILAIL